MAREFKLPDIGEGVHEGEVVKWFVKEGDPIRENDPVVEVMTDKVTVQIPSPVTGKVLQLRAKEGEVVKVGATLVVFGEDGEAPPATPFAPAARPTSSAPPQADLREDGEVERDGGPLHVRRGGGHVPARPLAGTPQGGRGAEGNQADVPPVFHQVGPRRPQGVPGPQQFRRRRARRNRRQEILQHRDRDRHGRGADRHRRPRGGQEGPVGPREGNRTPLERGPGKEAGPRDRARVHLHDHVPRQGGRRLRDADHQLARSRDPRHPQNREAPRGPERPDRGAGHDVLVVLLRPSRSRRTHRGGVRAIGAQLARTPGPPVRWTRVTCHTLEQTALSKRRSRGPSPESLPLTVGRSMYDRRAVLTPRGVLAIEMKAERRVTLVLCLLMVAAVSAGPAAATASGLGSSPTPDKTVFQKAGIVLPHGSPGEADSVYARAPFVLRDDDGTYKMWYSGYDGSVNRMLYASSPDGIRWTKHGVILDVGVPPYNWNSVGGQSVLKIQSVYHMWFSAGYWSGGPFVYWAQIYHAVSMDGLYWNVTGVVLPPNQFWDRGMTNSPWVVRDSAGLFWLFHSGWDGSNTRIGVATSGDGISFTPYAGQPSLDLGPSGACDQSDVN